MRVLFTAAEIFPFAKTGGLADIAHALPKALSEHLDVVSLMPLYRFIDKKRYQIEPTGMEMTLIVGETLHTVEIFSTHYEGVEHLFVYNETLCDCEGIYGPPGGCYENNDIRFAIFSHAIVELSKRLSIELLHLNDWHTALAAPLVKDAGLKTRIVFTIHNLAYQGIFPPISISRTGLSPHHFTLEDMEFYGSLNWLKGGIAHSDAVTTVSPSYAVEIQLPEFGCGLDGFLRLHHEKLSGILNGIDTTLYDPSGDPSLPYHFSAGRMANKSRCKKAYLEEIDIDTPELPLFIFIGRFVEQKGLDWIIDAANVIGKFPMVLSILGGGERRYEMLFDALSQQYSNIHVQIGYDESLSHRMYAAADFLLMPSRFEPCGLNQMIAMRYGTIPVVHRIGGLRDTVHPWNGKEPLCGKGVSFSEPGASGLVRAIEEAIELYDTRRTFRRIRKFDMDCDFSIRRCAQRYESLYRTLF